MHKWIAGAALAAVLTAGGAGVAVAQSGSGPSTSTPPPATSSAPNPQAGSGPPGTSGQQGAPGQNAKGSNGDCLPQKGPKRGRRALRAMRSAAAKAIGITPKELGQELRSGKSVADVAKAHNVDPQKVIDAIVADGTAHIDQAMKDGHLTQQKADALKKKLPDAATKFVNRVPDKNHPGPAPQPVPPGQTQPPTSEPPTGS